MKKFLAIITSISSLLLIACGTERTSYTVTFEANGGMQLASDKTALVQIVEKADELIEPVFERVS